jgi:hypothetical protein
MLPDEYREFFIASAGAAAALIGLLFVAVSVSPDQARQATTRVQFQSRASAALLVFTNALVISLSALVPGVSLGWWATAGRHLCPALRRGGRPGAGRRYPRQQA